MTPVRSHMPFSGHRTCAEWMICPVRTIQKAVAHYYGLSLDELLSSRRDRSLARPRQVAMYLAAELTDQSSLEIGSRFGRDHTTILHGRKNIAKEMRDDPVLRDDVARIAEWLTEQHDFPQFPAESAIFALAQTGPARIVNSETRRDGNPNRASDHNSQRSCDHGC